MPESLDKLNAFDVTNASLTLWAFKKSMAPDQAGPSYNGHWIGLIENLEDALKNALVEERQKIEEILEYSLLVQNNEGSALSITVEETWAGLITAQAAESTPARQLHNLKQINNAEFYVVRYVSGEDIIYAVKKADPSWKSRKHVGTMAAVFRNDQLELDEEPRFVISKYFDFYIVGDEIIISNKGAFESVLNFKQAHIEEFTSLQAEAEFAGIFTDLAHLVAFVGENKIHLRRVSAIRQKGHYKSADFMQRLRDEYAALGLALTFDADGKIIPSPDNCRDIIQALLDHRLDSRLSKNLYDVDNAATLQVGGA